MKKKDMKEIIDLLTSISDPLQMQDYLEGILTMQELSEIQKRLKIVKLLKKGIPQREIAEKLKVGISTVTRGSSEIKKGRFKYI